MKKFLSIIFIFMCLITAGLMYGCGDKYANLSFSIAVSYDGAKEVEDLPNGDKRVTLKNGGAFDDHMDGSYTFYIVSETNTKTTATVQANFSGVPDDFNYEVSHSLSTEILSVSDNVTYTGSGVKKEITANSKGRTELTLLNVESGKKDKVIIDVVEVASSMSFIDKTLAIVGSEGSTLTLNNEVVLLTPATSTLTNITYSIGEIDSDKNFTAWSSTELLTHGLRFNRETSVITVFDENLKMSSFYVMATYDNPVGENLTALTEVRVVNAVTNFEIYNGTTANDANNRDNIIASGDVNDLIVNIEGLSDKDIVLKVRSNGEEVNFNYIMDSSMPVYFPNNRSFRVEYYQQDGRTPSLYDTATQSYYKNATYALCFIKVCAGTKTTLNDRYPLGTYAVKFTCDYENYKVDNYPLQSNYVVKNDNLITSFAVNGEVQNNFSIVNSSESQKHLKPYDSEVYINSSNDVNGTPYNIDVGNTDSILQSNKKFTLELFKDNGSSNYENVTSNLSQYFSVKRGTGKSGNLTNVIDNFSNVYDCNTTFYFVPNALSGYVRLGDVFYLIVTAEKPLNREDKQAKATIKLNVVQGISEFTDFEYSYSQYKVNNENGEYATNEETGEKIVETHNGKMNFNADLVSTENLNLDLSSGFEATITLGYLPEGASLNNITILSSNEKVFEIIRNEKNKNVFNIKLHGVGQEEVLISVSHLDVTYRIKVNVYNPISNFNIRLNSTTVASGIGKYEENKEGDIVSSTVQVRKEIFLSLSTTPPTSNQYKIEYSAYLGDVTGKHLGTYTINFDGSASSVINVIGDADFAFICARGGVKSSCSFNFPTDTSVGKTYTIVIKLTNLDNSTITKSFVLNSYVPIKTIKTDVTRRLVYNPNTISFYSKTEDISDPTVFGLKIEALADNKDSKVTYDFDNYGRIVIFVNNLQEVIFNCVNGRLSPENNNNHLLTLVREFPDGDGYYWFKLNDSYDYGNVVGSVYYSIQINQLDIWFTQTNSFRVTDAERINTLVTYTDEQLYYKQGFSQDDLVDIQVLRDSAFNKNLLVKVYDLIETPTGNFYYDLQDNVNQNISCVTGATIENGRTSSQFNLRITPSVAGRSVIVVMPEDKIITREHYNNFTTKEYIKVDVTKDSFIPNIYYIRQGVSYLPAPSEFDESLTYYAYSTVLKSTLSLWKYCLVFYMSVADGVKVPYQIASYDDLKEVSLNSDSVTKRYVLTKNITVITNENWTPIGNYYVAENVTAENFKEATYYTLDGSTYNKEETFKEDATYYTYGFNGEISGKYSYENVKTEKVIESFYKVTGLSFEGIEESSYSGFISNLGYKGRALNLNIGYGVFRPSISNAYTFGGITANNFGFIENSITSFDNVTITSNYKTIVGGVAGENKGTILNNVESNIGVKGIIRVVALDNNLSISVGGLVGVNRGKTYGSFTYAEPDNQKFTFNDAGFNSTLSIYAELGASISGVLEKSSIGGAVGTNYGLLKDVSIKGSISAPNFNNVGGLVGSAEFTSEYNDLTIDTEGDEETTQQERIRYSIDGSYSIAIVTGNNNVGGAIGSAGGTNANETININYTSAENYATNDNYNRVFVTGKNNVGGLIGNANFTNIQYSYVVSYFECMPLNEAEEEIIAYDIVGINAGGLIGLCQNSSIKNSASFVNIKAEQTGDLFIHTMSSTIVSDVFVIGYVRAESGMSHNITSVNIDGYFYYIAKDKTNDFIVIRDSNSIGSNTTPDNIINNFGTKDGWQRNDDTNSGLPILTVTFKTKTGTRTEPLFATTPINISAITKEDENQFVTYIRNDDNSLIIFYNYDYLSRYLADDINKLNLVDFLNFVNLEVYPRTGKSRRLDIATNNSKVISIDEFGILKILGEGRVTLTISSKLNSNFKAEVYIVVKYGVEEVKVYKDISSNITLDKCKDENRIVVLKNRTQSLFVDTTYTRDLDHETDAMLKPSSEVGIRFEVSTDDSGLQEILDELRNLGTATDINGLFKINGNTWVLDKDGLNWYVDISSGVNPIITPLVAMENNRVLKIKYTPYIKSIFNAVESTISLTKFAGDFELSIIKGATGILIENNLDNQTSVEISQLETHTFTVTLFTDFESDEILDNFATADKNGLLTIVKSNLTRKYTDETGRVLESISATYTVNYKDKINAVEEDITFPFTFTAGSNSLINQSLNFIVVSQDKINQVYGTIYSATRDFPQTPNKNPVIYNGQVGVLSVEVYPYFSNYNSMRIYYKTPSAYPMLVTQLSYDITGETGQFLTNYPESGSIQDMSNVMRVEKSSGQDSYLLNPGGIYSYSKVYFFSLLVGTEVPDKTKFTFYVEFLKRDGTIIETFAYDFITAVQPSVVFNFDEKLLGTDNTYYLPLNTVQDITVNLVNYDGEITWDVTSTDYRNMSQNEIDTLIPYLAENGEYKLRVFKYESKMSTNNVLSPLAIGKHFTVTATIKDNENVYTFSQNFIITLFTVTNVTAQNVARGYMTIPMSTTTPLLVNLDTEYDKALVEEEDNWYKNWYDASGNDINDNLYQYITACGYAIEESFSRYFIQLSNAIAKANYNYKDDKATKTSGVWFYDSGDETSGYLQVNREYNNTTFGVELYNEYISVYGYQIDRNSKISLRTNISYTNNEGEGVKLVNASGIPNVYNYSIAIADTTFENTFTFTDEFILNFVYKSDLINAIPISTPEEFLTMQEGFDYRLVNDIELVDYIPISTPISSLDGNNFKIYITGFGYPSNYEDNCVLGLFDTISTNTMLYNVSVYYTSRVTYNNDGVTLNPSQAGLNVTQLYVKSLTFGGIGATNNGVLTNCKVSGRLNLTINNDINVGAIPDALNGGLVARNSSSGYITNSSIVNFDLSTYGITAGVVGENSGKIVSSYLDASSITNLSSAVTAGFVYSNSSNIYECYAQGYRADNDNDIRNTGNGIQAEGNVGGFAYSNNGNISDCYTNISLKTSSMLAGFVFTESSSSIISRCYSISYKSSSDNSRIASPFAGANSADYSSITINGQLNYCYYLTGDTWTKTSWASTQENKQAKELSLDEFSTHTNFVSYDLSLVYDDTQKYADEKETYSYVDGYTWVIIEGKPVIVSTLIKTISQRGYVGKVKHYEDSYEYFVKPTIESQFRSQAPINLGQDRIKTNYYFSEDGKDISNLDEKDIIYYTIRDNSRKTITYYFQKGKNSTKYNGAMTITFQMDTIDGVVKRGKVLSASYINPEDDSVNVLDVRERKNQEWIEDSNYRANDTIEIITNDAGEITKIEYKELKNASYYYNSNVNKVSDLVGTRTNPQIIYDYNSFVYYLRENTAGKFYRIIKDIDFVGSYGYFLPDTVYSNFQGALQGNYMSLNQISISYVNNLGNGSDIDTTGRIDFDNLGSSFERIEDNQEAFGVFGTISTVPDNTMFNTVISNLSLNVVEVLSNTHERVGALAGKIHTEKTPDLDTKVILNNISVNGMGTRTAHIQGKNAAGGLAGIILGDVIIKDINVSANVNATKDVSSGNVNSILYTNKDKIENISYAGGVVGILDCNSIVDASTQRNYNASNIHFYGNVHITGGVVGGAFGLVGRTSVVNYANVDVSNGVNNYLEASVYAGGLVGENRGIVKSSSVSYRDIENYSSVKVGVSNLIENLFFRSSAGSDSAVASGGLVGLNNGGILSNSLTSVDVRDTNTRIAGGAVGRLITGTIKNVIATGSLMSKSIMGGLVGTANDSEIVRKAGYNEDAIQRTPVSEDGKVFDENNDNEPKTFIIDCVSANNWLTQDYWQYDYLQRNNNAIAGFIGLIANTAGVDNFIQFQGTSFYTNTIYTSTNASVPQKYLKVAYFSKTIDIVTEGTIKLALTDSEGNQSVFPYSTREAYYEDTDLKVSYNMYERENPKYIDPDSIGGNKANPYVKAIYELRQYNVENPEDFYVKIDFDDKYWSDGGYYWDNNKPSSYQEYVDHFGIIYMLEIDRDGKKKFERIDNEATFDRYKNGDPSLPEEERVRGDLYYIRTNKIPHFTKTTSYKTGTANDIILSTGNSNSDNNKVNNDYTFLDTENLGKVTSLYLNGLLLKWELDKCTFNIEKDVDAGWYTATYSNLNFVLPNSSKIIKITITANSKQYKLDNEESTQTCWEVSSIDITYDYNTSQDYITVQSKNVSTLNYSYSLHLSSKKVIYNKFLYNGYWQAGENFFLDGNYEKADKYLTNLEFADVYLWTSFASEEWSESQINSGNLEISTPEQFAMFANMVNKGTTFEGKTIKLVNDVDLSGKFWVPIGSKAHPFKGTFDAGIYNGDTFTGNCYKIKYITVNETSNSKVDSLGGIFGYVSGATIKNLVTIGGDVYGLISGGVVAMSNGTIILENVSNRNNVTGTQIAGGIIGKVETLETGNYSLNITNCVNYGDVDHQNTYFSSNANVYLGGVIGSVESSAMGRIFSDLTNYGSIQAISNCTSYAGDQVKIELNVGGVIGNVDQDGDNYTNLYNYGNITITTNAHALNVGGVIGITKKLAEVTHSKNYATLGINYNNIYSEGRIKMNSSTALIGGIVGSAKQDVLNCGNEGKIDFNLGTTSSAFIGIGGVAGITVADIEKSYSANNIEVYTITRNTSVVIGGIAGGVEITRENRVIANCYNSGDIQATCSSIMYAGGIVGSSFVRNPVSETQREYSFYTAEPYAYHLAVNTCLNVGHINVIEIKIQSNGLGAIAGYASYGMQFLDNFYLRDSAYSGSKIYKAYCLLDDDKSDDEERGYYIVENDDKNFPRLMTSLKNISEYTKNWSFASETNPDGVWQQYYDTWFPSLRENNSSSMWSDKLEDVSQEQGSFVVKSAEELAFLADIINRGELDSSTITIKLTNFIDLSNRYWIPIGTQEQTFKGKFDGNGFVIRNLTIDGEYLNEQNKMYGGLFGYCEDATITDVGLESVIIQNVDYAGALTYNANACEISRIYTDSAKSNDAKVSAIIGAGGLVYNLVNSSPKDINDNKAGLYYSYNNQPVETIGGVTGDIELITGGLVGRLDNSLISNCYNNVKGNLTTQKLTGDNVSSGSFIADKGFGDSNVINVFNLASSITTASANPTTFTPRLYKIEVAGENNRNIVELPDDEKGKPTFENLKGDSNDNSLSDIWTQENEYTLNEPVDNTYYPSIRGLGGSWKNTESESLIGISGDYAQVEIDKYLEEYNKNNSTQKTLISVLEADEDVGQQRNKTYYFITNEEELAWLSTNVNSGSLLTNKTEFILMKDLDLSGKYWTPIGSTSVYAFQGIFNMNGHRIKGITIDSANLLYGGLFGYTTDAKIINGYIEDAFIKIISASDQSNVYVGAVVGRGYNTTIQNVSVTTAMSVTTNAAIFAGGAIGSLTGTTNYRTDEPNYKLENVIVNKSINKKSISGSSNNTPRFIDITPYKNQVVEVKNESGDPSGTVQNGDENKIGIGAFSEGGNVYVGGVVGYASGYRGESGSEVKQVETISGAYSNVNIAAITMSSSSRSYAGGIVGFGQGEVIMDSVKSMGIAKTFTRQYDCVGGIAGYLNDSDITNAYFGGYIEPCQNMNNLIISRAGGIVGFIESTGKLNNCYSTGAINSNPKYQDNSHIGAIIGYTRGRDFSGDNYLIRNASANTNFSDFVGYDENNNNQDRETGQPILFSTNTSLIASNFDNVKWNSNDLITTFTFVKGCDNSVILTKYDKSVNLDLSKGGTLVRNQTTIAIKSSDDSTQVGATLQIAGRNSNGDYVIYEDTLTASGEFYISGMVSSTIDFSKTSIILVKIIPNNPVGA